ncbi:hypothetical protein PAXRUDRAFT_164421 [Paxillus rubicundulus Ve08.2h10]|uniref:RNase H type-1 domain-containing protein n=1 Tax=Paxillus rubicundulus Ve08.2h10 TaxID=930991 RepID=A0A0D0DJG5_9AGAM|nr:hypothetical protein PAXRUDRAFT_164421 [Paxillus rubicundulus Ve08.2h10]
MEAHTKLLPPLLCIQNHCHQAILQIAVHPPNHPLHHLVRRASRHYIRKHQSLLHHLMHAFDIHSASLETICHLKCPPHNRPTYCTHVATMHEKAIKAHDKSKAKTKVYCNRSGIDGNIGATAVLFNGARPPHILHYHLGLMLAAQLLESERDLELPVAIYIDNQAAIKSGDAFITKSGHYLIDHFRSAIKKLCRELRCKKNDILVCWILGHDDVKGNEKAKGSERPQAYQSQTQSTQISTN